MKPYNGFKPQASHSDILPDIPVGAYVARIMKASEEETQWGDKLVLQVEVAEGDYKGYFQRQLDSKPVGNFPAKYKGILKLRIPTDEISNQQAYIRRDFENAIFCIEQSNKGWRFDWTTASMVGKWVGINVREFKWVLDDGSEVTGTEIAQLELVDDVRAGKCRKLKMRLPRANGNTPAPAPTTTPLAEVKTDDDDFPF